jgi:hypothetical protein
MKSIFLGKALILSGFLGTTLAQATDSRESRTARAKDQLTRVRDSLAATSDKAWEKILPKAKTQFVRNGHPEVAKALDGLRSPVRRALLQTRLSSILEEQNQLGLLLLFDMVHDMIDTNYDTDTLHSRSCDWASASDLSCAGYWTFVVLTADATEMPIE